MKEFFKKKGIKGIIFAGVLGILFLIFEITGVFTRINNFFMDKMYQKPRETSNIVIIGIDDKTLEELENYNGVLNRDAYAKVLKNINTKNPAVVGFDILFTGPQNEESDNKLAAEAHNTKNIVCASNLIFTSKLDQNNLSLKSEITDVSYPYDKLNNEVATGYANSMLDKTDGIARKMVPTMEQDNKTYDSFSYAIYKKYCEENNININTYKNNKAYRFNYSSLPGDSYTVIPFIDMYNYDSVANPNKYADLEGAIVLIGSYCAGLQDSYYTPIKSSSLMYGVEVHANMIDAYIRNDIITEVNVGLIIFIAIIILILFAYLIYKSNIIFSSISAVVLIGLSFGLQTILYVNKIYHPFMDLVFGLLFVYIIYIGFKYGEEYIIRHKTLNVFKKYVAPQVVDKALKSVDYKVNVEGEKRHISCLFVDIRGFTPLSEGLDPEDVVSILNDYLTLTTNSIFEVGGTLDKFIGDATMAIFNAPFDLDDYLFKSVKAAWLIASGSEAIDKIAMEKYGKHVSFGIGVNCGYAVVGNIGSKSRIDYTAIGDTVNTAARLEANAKAGEILISEELYKALEGRIEAECIGGLSLKGKSKEVMTYRVTKIIEEA